MNHGTTMVSYWLMTYSILGIHFWNFLVQKRVVPLWLCNAHFWVPTTFQNLLLKKQKESKSKKVEQELYKNCKSNLSGKRRRRRRKYYFLILRSNVRMYNTLMFRLVHVHWGFFLSILWCSQICDHCQEDLAKLAMIIPKKI